jgi:predicted aspartyl protease
MQLMITIAGTELRALVDSGSTHTFIHDAVVHSLGLDIVHQPGLSVKVANGERLQSYGPCKATTVTIQG